MYGRGILDDVNNIVSTPLGWLGVTVGATTAAVIMGILLLVVIYYAYKFMMGESFMPTSLMRMQQNDNMLVMSKEHLDSGRNTSFFASAVQNTAGGQFDVNASSAPGQPGSMSYQILNSPDFNCASRTVSTDDAWQWMQGVSSEGMTGTKDDNQLSALLAGH
jgi:hypothetical protein